VRTRVGIAVAVMVASIGCAPTIDGPVERQRAADRDDSARLAAQLGGLPGTVDVRVMIHRAALDPLARSPGQPATAAILLVVDDQANRPALTDAARQLVRATVPEVANPAIVVQVGARRPELAKVGPFVVEQSSKAALRAVLAIALTLIALLAAWIAYRERGRTTH
jgi:type III secretory pathway lipoprotein EscJ